MWRSPHVCLPVWNPEVCGRHSNSQDANYSLGDWSAGLLMLDFLGLKLFLYPIRTYECDLDSLYVKSIGCRPPTIRFYWLQSVCWRWLRATQRVISNTVQCATKWENWGSTADWQFISRSSNRLQIKKLRNTQAGLTYEETFEVLRVTKVFWGGILTKSTVIYGTNNDIKGVFLLNK